MATLRLVKPTHAHTHSPAALAGASLFSEDGVYPIVAVHHKDMGGERDRTGRDAVLSSLVGAGTFCLSLCVYTFVCLFVIVDEVTSCVKWECRHVLVEDVRACYVCVFVCAGVVGTGSHVPTTCRHIQANTAVCVCVCVCVCVWQEAVSNVYVCHMY